MSRFWVPFDFWLPRERGPLPQKLAGLAVETVQIELLRSLAPSTGLISPYSPTFSVDSPASGTALVTKIRSPHMIGLE